MRRRGEIIARFPNPEDGMGKTLQNVPFYETSGSSHGIYQRKSQTDGVERMYAWRNVDDYNLAVFVGQNSDAIAAPVNKLRESYFRIGAITSLLFAVIGYLLLNALHKAFEKHVTDARTLNESQQLWKFALEGAGDGVWDWRNDTGKVSYSMQWKKMLGYDEYEIEDKFESWERMVHPDDKPVVLAAIKNYLSGQTPTYACEHRLRCKDGRWKWILSRGMVISRDADGKPLRIVGTHSDITISKERENLILHQAEHDSLTNLPTRVYFFNRLKLALAAARESGAQLAVMFIDIDNFKCINDMHGHAMGDIVLQESARRMQCGLKDAGLLARTGGDEFILLLPVVQSEHEALDIAEAIRRFMNQPVAIENGEMQVSCSIGVAIYPRHGQDEARLTSHADKAMYQAKQAGRNRIALYAHEASAAEEV